MKRIQSKKTKKKAIKKRPFADREKKFAYHYLQTLNAKQSAIAAFGYTNPNTAAVEGNRMLSKPNVQDIIKKEHEKLQEESGITVRELLMRLRPAIRANMGHYWRFDEEGQPYLDMSDLTDEQLAAIKKLKTKSYWDEQLGRQVTEVDFELRDTDNAIKIAGQHLGMFGKNRNAEGQSDGDTFIQNNNYTLQIGSELIPVENNETANNQLHPSKTISATATRDL